MSACEALAATASEGVAPALRAVDCLANEAAASAFGRLFGGEGALVPALTILLTLYIAFFAISLLTGRSRLGVSALTPRMLTLGLVLTFATSWVAYQGVVWNLAVGAPDQIAAVVTGTRGSATGVFADRIDLIFAAIAEVATDSGQSAQGAGAGVTSGSFTPANVMWLGAILLLLGTVGVLVTVRIALAVLLALGPVFVVLGLFSGTRGLTAGWLRGVVLTAITPLFVVLGGGLMLELLVPVVAGLRNGETIDGRAALSLFMIACVHLALMAMVLRVVGTMVAGWSVFGLASPREERSDSRAAPGDQVQAAAVQITPLESAAAASAPRRSAGLVPALMAANDAPAAPSPLGSGSARTSRTVIAQAGAAATALPPRQAPRARGVGSRFRSKTTPTQGMIR
jgi:type IV secretion system protein VirB6